jgi:hypothetical protein
MRKLLSPLIQSAPFLIEFLTPIEDEDDVDMLQLRKCDNFKRMLLATLPKGASIGIPVPIAYDDIRARYIVWEAF